jgi:hypothetical protein
MMLQDSIMIKASPDAIFRFFEEMERNYLQWHPDHVLYRWVAGQGVKEGHVFYFEEYITSRESSLRSRSSSRGWFLISTSSSRPPSGS